MRNRLSSRSCGNSTISTFPSSHRNRSSSLQIGRSTLVSSEDKTSDEDDECYASLWDFVNSTESELTVVQDTEETAAKAHEGGEIGTP